MAKPILFVVDDDRDTVQQLERDLEEKYGDRYRVLGSTSARNALEKLRQLKDENEAVALILADQQMPEMSGVELLKQATTIFPRMKRVLLVPYRDAEAAMSAIREFRIDNFLVKREVVI